MKDDIDEVLAAYLEAQSNGWAPDRQRLLRCYPHLADQLERFLGNSDMVDAITVPLRPGVSASAQSTVADVDVHGEPRPAWPCVPGYEILGEIARGGMGVVYRARQLRADRVVALKMILSGGHAGRRERERFSREAEAVARLQHPGIVPVYEVGEHDGLPFFSMEYCPGGSLADHLDGTPLPPRQAAALVETIARAVHVCHQHSLIHRDLKPANVLLAGERRGVSPPVEDRRADAAPLAGLVPKISDFGLAKDLAASAPTMTNAVVGTPSYMAPEQASGESGELGPGTDVYALGAILYECLTGRPPFKAATPLDTVRQVVNEEPVPPSQLQPGLPPDLESVCLRCLQKRPERRYPSAEALADDLRRFLAAEPVTARPVRALERGWRWVRRNPLPAGLGAAVLVSLVAGSVLATYFGLEARRQAREAEQLALRASAAEQRAEERARDQEGARQSAARQWGKTERQLYTVQLTLARRAVEEKRAAEALRVLESTRPELRGWEYQYVDRLCRAADRPAPVKQLPVQGLAIGPEGRRVAGHAGDVVEIWDVTRGRKLTVLPPSADRVHAVAFSPDGRVLASAGVDRTLNLWDAETGKPLLGLRGQARDVQALAFSPDGRRLAGAGAGPARVWDAQTGKELLRMGKSVRHLAYSPDGKRLALAEADGTVVLSDADAGGTLATLAGHPGGVGCLAFSADGARLATGGADQLVRFWDSVKGAEPLVARGHTGAVTSVAFSPDGKRVVSGGADRALRIWDADTAVEMLHLGGFDAAVGRVSFSHDGELLVCGIGQNVRVWDAAYKK